jgi:betaine-aldehyde dehydrogenase
LFLFLKFLSDHMSLPIYKNFVDGQYISNINGECFDVINPATGQIIYQVEVADESVKQAAINSASKGFIVWAKMSGMERSRVLLKAVNLLRERNDFLAEIEVADTGKPWQEACVVDVHSGADAIEFFAGLAPSIEGDQQQVGEDFYYTRPEPLGICAGIGAWNYPLQIACWKAAPALACGNVMIFKPSEETPLGALKLAEILFEAGLPAGVFNVLQGDGEVGAWLSHHPDIAKVSFTGEVGTGKKVMAGAASTLKEVTMELGGKSPLIIFDDADIDNAVSAAMLGNFYTQGEICTNATRVFVHKAVHDVFVEKLRARVKNNIVVGDPMHPDTNFGALISKKHQELVLGYIEKGLAEGATLLCGGDALQPEGSPNGYFVAPTVFIDCQDDMSICREEIFGPVMSILKFVEEEEVITRANNTQLGLAAGVFTQDITRAHRIIHQMQAGICWINSYGLSPVEMPVGGYKQSGIGRENGLATLRQYTQLKSVYIGLQPLDSPF